MSAQEQGTQYFGDNIDLRRRRLERNLRVVETAPVLGEAAVYKQQKLHPEATVVRPDSTHDWARTREMLRRALAEVELAQREYRRPRGHKGHTKDGHARGMDRFMGIHDIEEFKKGEREEHKPENGSITYH